MSADNDWLKEGFKELKDLLKEVKEDISELKMEQITLKSSIDSAHTKIRQIEDCNKRSWVKDSLNEVRQSVIKGTVIFLMIFLPMSCSNIKKSLNQTIAVVTQQQIQAPRDSTK